jgi:putative transposase
MHLTLKKEATKPAAKNFLQQQGKFDDFIDCFNNERPHQALGMKYPAELYVPSQRPYKGLSDLEYPFHDRTITVTNCGRICIGKRKINLSQVFAGQNVGIKEVAERIWLVSFMKYDLGYFDHETARVESAENPFGAKVFPCVRNRPRLSGREGGIDSGLRPSPFGRRVRVVQIAARFVEPAGFVHTPRTPK